MRIDVMVDIETLGTNSGSTIIQVAAIAFDIFTKKRFAEFNMIADVSKNKEPLSMTESTIEWWLKNHKGVFLDLMKKGVNSSEDIIISFHTWLLNLSDDIKNVYLWGNGILFDNKMIQHQMEKLGLTYPIYYKNDRDVRTLLEATSFITKQSEKEIKESYIQDSLVEHNALDDVRYQIELVSGCYNRIIKQ